jgi:hypothetical protein
VRGLLEQRGALSQLRTLSRDEGAGELLGELRAQLRTLRAVLEEERERGARKDQVIAELRVQLEQKGQPPPETKRRRNRGGP